MRSRKQKFWIKYCDYLSIEIDNLFIIGKLYQTNAVTSATFSLFCESITLNDVSFYVAGFIRE